MRAPRKIIWSGLAFMALLYVSVTPVHAQGKSKAKHYAVSGDKAVKVSRAVLVERGFHVVRVERDGTTRVIYFRRGNNGRGKGKGSLQRMVIRTARERVYFEEAEPSVLVDIDVRLKL
jgi:uncharacterized protein (UPF0548 family)